MGIFNKRNAMLGWLTWKVGKGAAKKKAKGAMPGKSQTGGKNKPALFAGIAAALGGAALLRRRRKDGDELSQ
jgi:LPXTG-motif cell wall-anchored protein